MNKVHLYIVLYGFLIFMVIDTVLYGFAFDFGNGLYALTNAVMLVFVCTWLLRALPFLVISAFYAPYVARMKADARAARQGRPYTPLVSVVIPAYNEAVGIVPTIKTLLASSYRRVEILVVNDGSTDGTEAAVLAFLRKYRRETAGDERRIAVRYYRKENGGKGSALNYGVAKAHGEILCTFDADSVIAKDCIERFVSYFVEPGIMAVAGNIKIGNRQKIIGVTQFFEYLMAFRLKQAEAMLGIVLVIGGAASAFRREVFDRLGGYDTSMLTEDMELSFRIQAAGMRVFYAHDAQVFTEGPGTWAGLRKQRVRWKRGRIETMHRYRQALFSRTLPNRRFFWGVLPLVYVQDVEFLLCASFTVLVYGFCFAAMNFTPILATVLLSASLYSLQLLQERSERSWSSWVSVPLTWFLFHFAVVVEAYALIVAYLSFWTGKDITWQKWARQGVLRKHV